MNGIVQDTLGCCRVCLGVILRAKVVGNDGVGPNGKADGNGIDQILYGKTSESAVMASSLILAT